MQKRGKRNFKTSTGRIKTGRDRIISKYENGSGTARQVFNLIGDSRIPRTNRVFAGWKGPSMGARKVTEMKADGASQALCRAEGAQLTADGDPKADSPPGSRPLVVGSAE